MDAPVQQQVGLIIHPYKEQAGAAGWERRPAAGSTVQEDEAVLGFPPRSQHLFGAG